LKVAAKVQDKVLQAVEKKHSAELNILLELLTATVDLDSLEQINHSSNVVRTVCVVCGTVCVVCGCTVCVVCGTVCVVCGTVCVVCGTVCVVCDTVCVVCGTVCVVCDTVCGTVYVVCGTVCVVYVVQYVLCMWYSMCRVYIVHTIVFIVM